MNEQPLISPVAPLLPSLALLVPQKFSAGITPALLIATKLTH
jgi:hypothetical protein